MRVTPGDANDSTAERLQILQMVEDQSVSPEEAARLLEALDRTDRKRAQTRPVNAGPRNIRIRITDTKTNRSDVDITLPVGLVNTIVAMAHRFAPGRIPDLTGLQDQIEGGYVGTLVDINNGQDRVEILVEPR